MRGPSANQGRRWRAAAVAALMGLTATACGGGGSADEVGTASGEDASAAGSGAGELVGAGVNEPDDDDEETDESSTTVSSEAPPESSSTTAAPVTTAPPRTTAPPQTAPPQTAPPVINTPQTAPPKPTPNVVGVGALGGDRRSVYDNVVGGLQVEAGLNNSAQTHANNMAASGNSGASSNLYAETGFPWASVNEVTAQGPDVGAVINSLKGQGGAFAGYSHVGVGVASGAGGVYVSVRVGRQ